MPGNENQKAYKDSLGSVSPSSTHNAILATWNAIRRLCRRPFQGAEYKPRRSLSDWKPPATPAQCSRLQDEGYSYQQRLQQQEFQPSPPPYSSAADQGSYFPENLSNEHGKKKHFQDDSETGERLEQSEILLGDRRGVRWVSASGKVNDYLGPVLVEGGREKNGEPLYIVRAHCKNGIHPGKAGRHLNDAHIPWGGKEELLHRYEILVGDPRGVRWISMSGKVDDHLGAIPVEGGREKNGEPLYIARAYYKDGIHPGKAGRHLEDAHIPWGGKENLVHKYEILCYA
ncbi:hypothetical protein AX14_006535 [Amanita brunnescens Koide BX004]|nr:hypothetical protein AX14_006535 [Amanita brunnescens Koide BX004]